MDILQNKLRMGLEIETHLKKRVCSLEKKEIRSKDTVKKQISAILCHHSQFRNDIMNLLDEGHSEIKSVADVVVEKMRELEMSMECNLKSSQMQDKALHESECKDVHISADSRAVSINKINDPDFPNPSAPETGDTSEALALALQEKVAALLLLSQQEERHLLVRNVNAALQKKNEDLHRKLLQVTNEKVKALMELAQLKQELYTLEEKMSRDNVQGISLGEAAGRGIILQKDGKLKNLLKRTYLTRWVGGSDGSDADTHLHNEKPNHHMNSARMKIEYATLKDSLESMEHLLSSVHRLRTSLFKVKDSSAAKMESSSCFEALEQIIAEANLVKTAVASSLPRSWLSETDGAIEDGDWDLKVEFVSAAGYEMVELLIFAALLLKDIIGGHSI